MDLAKITISERVETPPGQRSYGATFDPIGKAQADIRRRRGLNDPTLIRAQPLSTNPTSHVFDSRRLHQVSTLEPRSNPALDHPPMH